MTTASISVCGQYRYLLTRPPHDDFVSRGQALFIMLNPSTADATIDDPTIRRCRAFAKEWDCAGIAVANLYALRATDPKALWKHPDPIGPENDLMLYQLSLQYETIVCAWGSNAKADRVEAVLDIFSGRMHKLFCLGVTKDGSPKHPLYVRADQPLVPWPDLIGF